ncbi:Lsr2 family protein [Microbacterium sp. VKM Ac-2870]|uniref:histone-like nucleoid-structuring protein Lsr2 n=1 Tax=Microbacterium sp. VKM Ac-2870 TaxID=2783825 RepID=UPI00188B271A|nr:Lsr2 family protein [Microbacterium sp. VKM Ac-2870]MBF4561173.1 Lsr2 family protein [Microbacterium sp. VKM Ac-2870]
MAQKVIVELVDDLDGTAIKDGKGGSVSFALGKKSYDIDLSDTNLSKLEEALAPFIDAARPSSSAPAAAARRSSSRSTRKASGVDLAAVREWARANGHTVSERGRVPAAVLEAYAAVQ